MKEASHSRKGALRGRLQESEQYHALHELACAIDPVLFAACSLIDDQGIGATLSFNQRVQPTFIPWPAVYLIADYDGNGAVWQDDIPGEVLERVAAALDKQPIAPLPAKAEEPSRPSRPKLVALPETDDASAASTPEPEAPRPRPALRLVK